MRKIKITVANNENGLFENFAKKKFETHYDYMKRMVKNDYRLNFRTRDLSMVESAKMLVHDGVIDNSELEVVFE